MPTSLPWTGVIKAHTILPQGGRQKQDVPTLPKMQTGIPLRSVQYKAQPEALLLPPQSFMSCNSTVL